MFANTILDAAETLTTYERFDVAQQLLRRAPFDRALTVNMLSNRDDANAIDRRFRYWRLRHIIARKTGNDSFVAKTVPPADATPAGNDVDPSAPVHADTDAIELAARIDSAVLTLARIDAATTAGDPIASHDAWSALLPLLVFQPSAAPHSSATLGGIAQQKPALMRVIVEVATHHSAELGRRLADVLAQRFVAQPERWSLKLRLQLARQLRLAGVATPWYGDTLALEERSAAEQDVDTRLQDTAALVHSYAADGNISEARRLATTLIPMAFGVGFRKDYQFDGWVDWLARALDEAGAWLIGDAAWLARLIDAANPLTEGGPGVAAARLPAAVVGADPAVAVQLFTHLVGHGSVDHVDALATLTAALAEHADVGDEHAVFLAADLTAELIVPASRVSHRNLAEALAAAATRVLDPDAAAVVLGAVWDRINVLALRTTRADWEQGLGVAAPPIPSERDEGASDYESLVLNDGRRIRRDDVSAFARGTDDIVALRRQEAADSSFSWMRLLDARQFDTADLEALIELFHDGTHSGGDALTVLAEHALKLGSTDLARRLAEDALQATRPNSWSGQYGSARRRAAAVAVRAAGHQARVAVYRDLAEQAIGNQWFAGLLLGELAQVIEAIAPELPAQATWPEIRGHLEGIAATLALPDDDPLADRGPKWWLDPGDQLTESDSTGGVTTALVKLAVLHLSHPTWVARDAAARVVARALIRGDATTATALATLVAGDATDDVLEYAGRAVAAARANGMATPTGLASFDRMLGEHPSQVLRDLAAVSSPPRRDLSPRYRLTLLPPADLVGRTPVFLAPHETQYRLLAKYTGIPLNTLSSVAQAYADDMLDNLPTDAEMREALRAADFGHYFPYAKVLASRSAFGRVLADLRDAGQLNDLPPNLSRQLRTFDIDLLMATPEPRPDVLPSPPEAGHDQTLQRWLDEAEIRLGRYLAEADNGSVLIGAIGTLTVLNWDHLEEQLTCGTVVGDDVADGDNLLFHVWSVLLSDLVEPTQPWSPNAGETLLLANTGHTFQQLQADWLSFRSDVAAALGWTVNPDRPGRWHRADGAIAVDRVWWADGWWTHTSRAFDDTAAQGHAVVLTSDGVRDLTAAVGPLTRTLTLKRSGRQQDGQAPPSVTVSDSSTIGR